MNNQKLYCYVDETGQDTKGRFFLVSVIVTVQDQKDNLEKVIEEIEMKTGKGKVKWKRAGIPVRTKFLKSQVGYSSTRPACVELVTRSAMSG